MDHPIVPFSTIVYALREAGMEISARDVLQGIELLEVMKNPFVDLAGVEPVVGTDRTLNRERLTRRDTLIWIVQTLWARTDDERAIVRSVLEKSIAPAPGTYVIQLRGTSIKRPADPAPITRPPTPEPLEDLSIRDGTDYAMTGAGGSEGVEQLEALPPVERKVQAALNVPVPALDDITLEERTRFELQNTPSIDELSLASVWRRFRQPVLRTDPTRIDIDRSVSATIRSGGQLTIVPAQRRVNQARLLVLLDVSAAMAPWSTMRAQFEATLDPIESRLEKVEIWYFSGAPGNRVARDPHLRDREDLARVLQDWQGEPTLVLSEAGAARAPIAGLDAQMADFVSLTRTAGIRPVVWINPMPRHRWQPQFTRRMEREAHVTAFPMGYEALIEAVDVMREQAS